VACSTYHWHICDIAVDKRPAPVQSLHQGTSQLEKTDTAAHLTPEADGNESRIHRVFAGLPGLLNADAALVGRGRHLTVDCLLGTMDRPFHVAFSAGRIVDVVPAPILMRSWCFSYRASATAWTEFWKPAPRPGWHDLLALTKNGEAVLEGNLLPFMMHLQYFKDVLALPRLQAGLSA
jgi:hypothetical protein